MNKYKTIGILGGMGPEATAELYKRIIAIYQRDYAALNDADFPNILINSVPAEDMLNDLGNRRPIIVSQLQNAAQILEQAGAEFIAIPCNTATIFLEEMQASVNIPILDIIELTSQFVGQNGAKTVGMLASTSTINTKIYENKLNKRGITMLKPSKKDQQTVNQIIMRILTGTKNQSDKLVLSNLVNQLHNQGAKSIVLGCTELPLIISHLPQVQLIDTIEVLARAIVREAELLYM
jgi:aspartate racemase